MGRTTRVPYGPLRFLPRKKAMYSSGVNLAFRINLRSNPTPKIAPFVYRDGQMNVNTLFD